MLRLAHKIMVKRLGEVFPGSGVGRTRDEKGFALIITLVITALLVALTAEFVNEVYVDTTARHNFVDAQQASLFAESGMTGGIKILQFILAGQNYTSLLDHWAKPVKLDDEKGTLNVVIEEESGKLNLNQIVQPNGAFNKDYYDIAARLFKKLKLSTDLLDSLGDWIGSNETPRPAGAKSSYYGTMKPPYAAKGAKLETYEELRLVKGFDAKTMDKLRPFVTVYAEDPNPIAQTLININTAPAEVINALDEQMSDSLTDSILEYRKTTPIQLQADVMKIPGMDAIGMRLQRNIGVKGAVYRVLSQAKVNDTIRIMEGVVRMTGFSPTVLYWREF